MAVRLKTIFHVGHSKTGSTTLQSVFSKSQAALLQKGVLYPSNLDLRYNNHKLLFADMMKSNEVPRHIGRNYSLEKLPAARKDLQKSIIDEIERSRPDCLMLSSETRFGRIPAKGRQKFRQVLQGFGSDDIDIVAYVRLPSGWFLSAMNQRMRRSTEIKQPRTLNLVGSISDFFEDFGKDHVHLRPFAREALVGGDVLEDFCAHFLSDYDVSTDILEVDSSPNESFSSEALDIVRRYRAHFMPDKNDQFIPEGEELIKVLMAIEAGLKMPKPRLREALAEALNYGKPKLLELRDRFDLVVPGYDYSRAASASKTELPHVEKLEDIVEIDRSKQCELIELISRDSWVHSNPDRSAWFDQLPKQINADTGAPMVYRSADVAGKVSPGVAEKETHPNMTNKSQTPLSPEKQADRDLAVSIGRAIFRVAQGDMSDETRKAIWQVERMEYVKQGRAVLKRLRKDGFTLSK